MADEEEHEHDSCCFLHFADRYQADLELIYQKYEHLEDGCIESEEILLSNFGSKDDDEYDWLDRFIDGEESLEERVAADGSDGLSDDEGWESDSSGHTNTRELSSHDEAPQQSSEKKKAHKDVQNCEMSEKGKPMQFIQPLSSTLVSDSTGISEIKVDPKLSPVELPSNNDFKDFKGLENQHIALPNRMLDEGPGFSFLPGILSENILTSTKLESSSDPLSPRTRTTQEREKHDVGDITEKNPSPKGLASFARAVLNTRNKIRNVLLTVDMNFEKGYSSKESGYDSLSTDTTSSSSTVQSTLNESLCPPDKLLREFSNRLTAEMFSNGKNACCSSKPNYAFGGPSNSLTRRNQSVQKTPMLMGPNAMASNKNKTVSLLTNRRTIKFNPSLPELRKGMSSTPLSSENKSVYIPLSMNTKTVDQHGRLKESVSTKAVLKISPLQSASPTALVPKNSISIKRGASEQPNKLQLVQKSDNFSKPVFKLQESGRPCVAISRRRSVPLTNCLPVTNSEILRHSTNLSDFQRYMKGPEALPGRSVPGQHQFCNIPRNIPTVRERGDYYKQERRGSLKVHPDFHTNPKLLLPGQDGTRVSIRLPVQNGGGHFGKIPLGSSRKRSFDSALYCSNERTSPKRTCRRSNDDDDHEKEKIMNSLTYKEWQRKHQGNLNINGNALEMFEDMEEQGGNVGFGNSSGKEDELRESNSEKNFVEERKQRRHSLKLFTEGTRSPRPVTKINPHDNLKIPRKISNEGSSNTKNGSCGSCHKDPTTVNGRCQTRSRGSLVRIDREVVSPIYRDNCTQQLIRKSALEEFKKLSPRGRRTEVEDSKRTVSCSSETIRRSSCTRTSQEDISCYDDYRRSPYDRASEESYSRRCQSAGIRNSSSERHFFPDKNSRAFLELGDQKYQTPNQKTSTHKESNSRSSYSHEKLTSRKKLGQATVERTSTREIHSTGRKRDRESNDKAQGRDREICLNKTFRINKPSVLESRDTCCSPRSRCTKFICLNCGNFPSAIQDTSQSSADSFIGD